MRIVAYSNLYMPTCRAGAHTMLRDLLRPLRDRHEVSIVIRDGRGLTDPYLWEGIPVYPEARAAHDLGVFRSADLIITQLHATESATTIADELDIPVIQIMHAALKGEHEYLQRRCDYAIFNTYWVQNSFPEYDGPGMVVYPPIRAAEYRAVPGDSTTLVNLAKAKGSQVFYYLAEEFPSQPFLGVIGAYDDQEVRDLPNVSVMDSVDDMRLAYGRTRVLLMPSAYESFGRCAIEAAASGIPTIAAPTLGLRESLGTAGIFCRVDDPSAWATELSRLEDPRVWKEASEWALERSAELALITRDQLAAWIEVVDSFARERSFDRPIPRVRTFA